MTFHLKIGLVLIKLRKFEVGQTVNLAALLVQTLATSAEIILFCNKLINWTAGQIGLVLTYLFLIKVPEQKFRFSVFEKELLNIQIKYRR